MKKIFRKIHLWLSVPFGIFITLICFSGAMLVFEKEITEWCRPDLYFVKEVKEQPLPLDQLMEKVRASLPDSVSITGVTLSPDASRTYQVGLSQPRRASLYVNPYTGEVTGRSERLPFYDTIFHLHRWMLGPSTGVGKQLVGISTLLLVIILITGILMWLTNKHKPLTKSLTLSVTKGWPRFWHDLHVAGGIYATVFLLALALTGLTWSFSWYRTGFYKIFGVEASAGSYGGHGSANRGERSHAPATQQQGNNETEQHIEASDTLQQEQVHHGRHGRGGKGRRHREGDSTGEHAGRHRSDRSQTDVAEPANGEETTFDFPAASAPSPFAHWQQIYEQLTKSHPGYRQITLAEGSASVVPAGRNSLRSGDRFDFDTESGTITGKQLYAEQDASTKLRSAIYTIHVGSWGGLFTRVLTFLAALLGATLPITGYYLWIKKKLRKKHPQPEMKK